MTTAKELEQILGKRSDFGGVFLYDEIDKVKNFENKTYIVNYITSKETAIEGHYIVLDFRKPITFYFDAYGLPPDKPRNMLGLPNPKTITNILNDHGKWSMNKFDWQDWAYKDGDCGQYCVIYIDEPNFNSPIWKNRLHQPYMDIAVDLFGKFLS